MPQRWERGHVMTPYVRVFPIMRFPIMVSPKHTVVWAAPVFCYPLAAARGIQLICHCTLLPVSSLRTISWSSISCLSSLTCEMIAISLSPSAIAAGFSLLA